MKVDVGDLVAWEPRANIYIDGRHRPRSYGVVMTEEKRLRKNQMERRQGDGHQWSDTC